MHEAPATKSALIRAVREELYLMGMPNDVSMDMIPMRSCEDFRSETPHDLYKRLLR